MVIQRCIRLIVGLLDFGLLPTTKSTTSASKDVLKDTALTHDLPPDELQRVVDKEMRKVMGNSQKIDSDQEDLR